MDASAVVAFLDDCLDSFVALEEGQVVLAIEEVIAVTGLVLLTEWV